MLTHLTATELSAKLQGREVSAHEVAEAFLHRIESHDSRYNAFLTVASAEWKSWADAAQAKLDAGEAGPLTGVPIAIKDNISTKGLRTTCASKILDNYVPPFDATVVSRLKDAGTVVLGKTNMDEFAMGGSNEYSAYGPCRNPWDPERSPGGSSGGSAVAVAARFAPLSLGSDTGGSVRCPAALCGLVGFKPTYGRISRYGLVAFGTSLDQIGPLAHTVEDAALLASAISGHDPRDGTTLPQNAIDVSGLRNGNLKGKRIALPKELFTDAVEPGVKAAVEAAIALLTREGVEFGEVSVPEIESGVSTYYIIAPAEASSNLARFDGVRYGVRAEGSGHVGVVSATRGQLFGHEVKQRIMIGTYVLSAGYYDAFYLRAQMLRARLTDKFEEIYQQYDAVLSPTVPNVAFKLGGMSEDPLALKLMDYCTIPANLGGFPAISVPCGMSEGLPVGLQLMTPLGSDEVLFQMAYQVEQLLGPSTDQPPIP